MNSPANPATAGSVVTVYAFGTGLYSMTLEDGTVTGSTLTTLETPVDILFDGQAAQIIYAGSAPDLVAGVTQVNFRVPTVVATNNTVQIQSAAGTSGAVLAIAATNQEAAPAAH